MMHNEIGSKSDYFETPNLEILAEEGMRFSDAYSSAPVCAPHVTVFNLVKLQLDFH